MAMTVTGVVIGGRLAKSFCLPFFFIWKGTYREEIAARRFSVGGRLGRMRKTRAPAATPAAAGGRSCSGTRCWHCRPDGSGGDEERG
ncbi:hypothetical protein SBBP1_90021 [Burkholderiales bacterium]|nr:hypothetical protein SBBP1_90021 [Burkholderiales bacterium]